jgi:uncharacterized protein (TIGR03084 family)
VTGVPEIRADLADEQATLDALVAPLPEAGWDRATPAEGWAVRDQVSHLAWFDGAARLAVTDHEALAAAVAGVTGTEQLMAIHLRKGRGLTPRELLAWWRGERAALLDALGGLHAKDRIPWFGVTMSAPTFVTARLMETWAHGQDVVDGLGARRAPTRRLRHVAHLGVLARPYAYAARGQEAPRDGVFVALDAPGGDRWTWGDERWPDRVGGSALDFCLVVTQRRHLADTALEVEGAAAAGWLAIAQAFAGPPGPGRRPGQFPRAST